MCLEGREEESLNFRQLALFSGEGQGWWLGSTSPGEMHHRDVPARGAHYGDKKRQGGASEEGGSYPGGRLLTDYLAGGLPKKCRSFP